MKNRSKFILLLFLLGFVACNDNSKDSTSDKSSKTITTMSTITWTTSTDPNYFTGISNAMTEEDLASELIEVFNKIKTEKILETSNVLVFVDGTNSIIFFSDQDSDEDDDESSSGKTIAISYETSKLLNANSKNATYFENAALTALKQAIRHKADGKKIMADYNVYLRTETEDEEKLE